MIDQTRMEFEKWMRSKGETPSAFMESNGCYVDSSVMKQWQAWAAASQSLQTLPFLMSQFYYLQSRGRWRSINDILNFLIDDSETAKENIVCGLRCNYHVKGRLKAWDFLLTKATKVFGKDAKEVLDGLLSEAGEA